MMQDGPGIFAARPYAPILWVALVILAIVAVAEQFGYPVLWRVDSGSPLLLALPLIQASAFLASQRLFMLRYSRATGMLFGRKERTGPRRSSAVERPYLLGGYRLRGHRTVASCGV